MTVSLESLRERIAYLEEENAWLRSELGLLRDGDREAALRVRFKLTPGESRLLMALWTRSGSIASKPWIMDFIYGTKPDDQPLMKIIDVWVCKMRAKLPQDAIETVHGIGYRLTAAGVALVREVVG